MHEGSVKKRSVLNPDLGVSVTSEQLFIPFETQSCLL